MTKEPKPEKPVHHPWREARPNKLWPEQIRALIRFYVTAKGEQIPPCPACGIRRRGRWTMLCPFRAFHVGPESLLVDLLGEFPPLTLVCSDHPISPTKPIQEAL